MVSVLIQYRNFSLTLPTTKLLEFNIKKTKFYCHRLSARAERFKNIRGFSLQIVADEIFSFLLHRYFWYKLQLSSTNLQKFFTYYPDK